MGFFDSLFGPRQPEKKCCPCPEDKKSEEEKEVSDLQKSFGREDARDGYNPDVGLGISGGRKLRKRRKSRKGSKKPKRAMKRVLSKKARKPTKEKKASRRRK